MHERAVSLPQTHAYNIHQPTKLSFMEFHVCISLIEHLSYASLPRKTEARFQNVCFSQKPHLVLHLLLL